VRCVAILHKKGDLTWDQVIYGVLAVLVLGIVIFSGVKYFAGGYGEINKYQMEYNAKKGQEIVKQKQIEPGKAGDLDGDGVYDLYDICVYQDKSNAWVGKPDSDADGMPDACDENPFKPEVKLTCKEGMRWDKESAKAGVHKCILKTA